MKRSWDSSIFISSVASDAPDVVPCVDPIVEIVTRNSSIVQHCNHPANHTIPTWQNTWTRASTQDGSETGAIEVQGTGVKSKTYAYLAMCLLGQSTIEDDIVARDIRCGEKQPREDGSINSRPPIHGNPSQGITPLPFETCRVRLWC